MDIRVTPPDALVFDGRRFRCAVGRGGVTGDKREGDGATPAGRFPLRRVFYRADRLAPPKTALPLRALASDDGWCDDPNHPSYNRLVRLPHAAGHEDLWRDDGVYDVIVEVGYNDDPVTPDLGSAVFLHVARTDYEPTEGCVAIALDDLLALLAACGPEAWLCVEGEAG